MFSNRFFRWAAFGLIVLLFTLDSSLLLQAEASSCLGIRILSDEEMGTYVQHRKEDFSDLLEYNGTPAAVDTQTSTIYLSQSAGRLSSAKDLPGELKINSKEHRLFFAPDSNFSDLSNAVRSGHPFTLLVVSGDNIYMKYRVIFTTLPVLRLDGTVTHQNADSENVFEGALCLWTPDDPEIRRDSAKSSTAQWHIRGNTTAILGKKSWKISLKDAQGLNNDLDFLGLGADDDWILNAMSLDDTKLKEKLFQDLWNDWADLNPWNYKMSASGYVEVICNDRYSGIYLLQRRIDRKYYRLTENDILLKGRNTWTPANLQEAYEIIHSPLSEAETLRLMEGIYTGEDPSIIHLDSFLDVNLFLQYGSACDNVGFKNTFYLLKWQEDSYDLYMIPWDTDMTWGVTYTTGLTYNYQRSMNSQTLRREYSAMMHQIPELKALMSFRWAELRKSTLSEDAIKNRLEENLTMLHQSGVLQRDYVCWGRFYQGKDTTENLSHYLLERLYHLDGYYSE